MGHFTEDTLQKFQAMCAEGLDFGEGPVHDFAMCIKADGDIYGIQPGESCEDGKPISEAEAKKVRAKNKRKDADGSDVRMAKLKKAFLKKTGREMTKEELAKAAWMINKGK